MNTVHRKVGRSLKRRGLAGTTGAAFVFLLDRLKRLSPSRRAARRRWTEHEAAFDRDRGVDTAGMRSIAEFDGIVGCNADDGNRYQGVDSEALRVSLAALNIHYEDFTFLDLGCGKGRALLVASEFPFRDIVGVEFIPQLHAVAERNLSQDRGVRRCNSVRVELADAAEYPIPDGPLILYLYNPFGGSVLARVVENILRSLHERPRDIRMIYWNPECSSLLEERGFTRTLTRPDYAVYLPPSFA